MSGPFGAGAADLASCLGLSPTPACFSATRFQARAVAGLSAPGAPGGLSAAVTGSAVTLVWSAPASGDAVLSYLLEAGSTSGAANLASVALSSATTFSASGIPTGIYFVRVLAQNTAGVSPASNEVVVTIGSVGCAGPPAAPSGLAALVSGTTVTLTWSAPVGGCPPTSYTLQAGSAPGLSNLAASNTGNLATTYVAPGVGAGIYYVRILATNDSGSSAASNEVVATVGGAPGGSIVSGLVTDAVSGAAIASATVAVQGRSATTGADGRYSIASLTNGAATLTAQHQGHRNFSQVVTVSGASTVNFAMVTAPEAALAGNWAGTWRNTTFGSTGTATMAGTVDTVAQTFRGSFDLNGSVFGAGDPPTQTYGGPYTLAGFSAAGTSTFYGLVTVSMTAAGQITGTMTNLPQASISRVDFTGTATASTTTITYTVTFTAGGTAVGVLNFTKQ